MSANPETCFLFKELFCRLLNTCIFCNFLSIQFYQLKHIPNIGTLYTIIQACYKAMIYILYIVLNHVIVSILIWWLKICGWIKIADSLISVAYKDKKERNKATYDDIYKCVKCQDGCDTCIDNKPCLATYQWGFR